MTDAVDVRIAGKSLLFFQMVQMGIQTLEKFRARCVITQPPPRRASRIDERLRVQKIGVNETRKHHAREESQSESPVSSLEFRERGKAQIQEGIGSSVDRLDSFGQTSGQSGFAALIVGETGMMARNAVGNQPPQQSQTRGVLRPGRRVIDATGNLAGMRTNAQARAGLKIVLEGVAEFAEVMPETNKMSPIAVTKN